MKRIVLIMILIIDASIGIALIYGSTKSMRASANEQPQINVVGIKTVESSDDDGVHGAWVWLMLGTPDDEVCEKGTPQLIISFRIVYELYVDEYLDAAEWDGVPLVDCGDPYDALGGIELVNAFADTLEPMMQDDVMFSDDAPTVGGSVDGYGELRDAIQHEMDSMRDSMCYVPDSNSPTGGRWHKCTKNFIPIVIR